jgi:hypothetical protein
MLKTASGDTAKGGTQTVEYFFPKREETAVEDYGLLGRPSTDHGDDKVEKV